MNFQNNNIIYYNISASVRNPDLFTDNTRLQGIIFW